MRAEQFPLPLGYLYNKSTPKMQYLYALEPAPAMQPSSIRINTK
jgi:hypothetical protein